MTGSQGTEDLSALLCSMIRGGECHPKLLKKPLHPVLLSPSHTKVSFYLHFCSTGAFGNVRCRTGLNLALPFALAVL